MGNVKTNNVSLQIAVESAIGTLGGSPTWYLLEPNDITDVGAEITTTPRSPISSNRQNRKGTTTDLDSTVGFEHDLTREVFLVLSEGFVFATFAGSSIGRPTATDTDSYTVPSGPTLAANTLIYVRGCTNSGNNGLKVVDTGASATDIPVTTALTAETPPANALIEVAGRRFATSDLAITVSSGIATITSAAVDLTTLGLTIGQLIHVGGLTTGQQFSAGAGYGRLRTIATGTITLDKLDATLATDNGTGDTVDLLFGRFLRNVPTTHGSYVTRSYHVETAYPNLISASTGYGYSVGNLANELAFNLETSDKATLTVGMVGTDTETPTTTRKTGASSAIQPLQTGAYNTSSDVLRLRVQQVDETEITTCFKSATLTLGNGVTPEKCIGTLGATDMNVANFTVNLDAEVLFTSEAIAEAVRQNETVTLDLLLSNDDGAIGLDIPSLTLGGGKPSFPVNETVTVALTGNAFQDAFFGTSIGLSTFPVVP